MEVLFEVVWIRETVCVGAVPEKGVADSGGVAAAAASIPIQLAAVGLEGVHVCIWSAGDDDT